MSTTDFMAAMRREIESANRIARERESRTLFTGDNNGNVISVSASPQVSFVGWEREAKLHTALYSAFCQQWIAVAMAMLVGRE